MTSIPQMLRLPLRARLTVITALLSGVMMAAFGLGFFRMLEAEVLRAVDQRLAGVAGEVRALLVRPAPDGAAGEPPVVSEPFVAPAIVAKLILPDGRSILLPTGQPFPSIADDPALIDAARAGRTATGTAQIVAGQPVRLLATPIDGGNQADAILVVGEALGETQSLLASIRWVLLMAGILIAVLITIGVGLVMGPVLRVISTLTQVTAEVVASKNYAQRVPLPAQRDEIYQALATINDLISTVQRALDQQRQFLAFTSHELRSPLTVILGNLDLLRRDLTPAERMLSVAEATEEARRMRRLVNDLLLLAEQDSTRVVARTIMRLDSLIEETVAMIARQNETHRVRVEVEGPIVVEGDAERLLQVVRNLVENALMHTPAGTEVEVQLSQAQGHAVIRVSDNGPGIEREHLPRLWDRFYRVDKARSRLKGSTGLGLPIVKYIAEAHGGTIALESAYGEGATFTVLLPLARRHAEAADSSYSVSLRSV